VVKVVNNDHNCYVSGIFAAQPCSTRSPGGAGSPELVRDDDVSEVDETRSSSV
jgi:hypothetical protein